MDDATPIPGSLDAQIDAAILGLNPLTGQREDYIWRPADKARKALIAARDALAQQPADPLLRVADALGCFWNAALAATHHAGDATANAVMAGMVDGVAAVADRLKAPPVREALLSSVLLEALKLLVADVADYPAWSRPCHALDVAQAAIALTEDRGGLTPISEIMPRVVASLEPQK